MSPNRIKTWLPWLALLIIYTVWGSTYLAIRVIVAEMPPAAAASLRFLVAGLIMAGAAALRDGPRHGWPSPRQLRDYSLVGVLLLAVGNGLVMWAEQRIQSGIAALIVAMLPLWINLIDGLRPGRRVWSPRLVLGTACGLAGVALVARPAGGFGGGGGLPLVGVGALMLASLSWAAGSLYSQSVTRRLPLLSSSAVQMLAGAAVLAVESRLLGEDLALLAHASRGAWLALAYLVTGGSLLGFTAYAYCLNTLPARIVGTYAYVNPVVAVALGSLVLAEPVSAGLLGGGVLILAAVLLSVKGGKA